ncbi:discoidin domain-containing protein [Phytohabitans sp. ZYX-F-186]|uniref:Discoidin domain-containing protein n=1 Tax=Phytohabitans maris TaxID=3071409 RepID=A0ABU0ZF87_9ACTN|nr:discoidin domain-containing protein [Phytohabitans sp. ZYX-F-186]MDQ7905719.1 discoidin domain-containing protein [Phytohabitans sp. ZYX-F-186]
MRDPSTGRPADGSGTPPDPAGWMAALTPGSAPPAAEAGPRPGRRGVLLGVAVAAVLCVAAGSAYLVSGGDERPAATATPSPADAAPAAATPLAVPEESAPAPTVATSKPVSPRPSKPAASRPTAPRTTRPAVTGRSNPSRTNLARGRPVRASSVEGRPWAPANAVDGSTRTRWSSAFSDPQWISVDLGANWRVGEVVLAWQHAHATRYQVDVSLDGRRWSTVYATRGGREGTVRIDTGPVVARHVRVLGLARSNQYGYSLWELEVR